MSVIDYIIEGQPMPGYINDFEAPCGAVHSWQCLRFQYVTPYGYTYIPYCHNNINYAKLNAQHPDAVSSRFSGCLMVAYEKKSGGIFAGHVQTEKDRAPYDCRDLWEAELPNFSRFFAFRPSIILNPSPTDVQPLNCYGFLVFENDFNTLTAFAVSTDANNIVSKKEQIFSGDFAGRIEL